MSALDKFLVQNDSEDLALGAGAGTWAGATAGKGAYDAYRDRKFMKGKKATQNFGDFLAKLEEGDILFHRKPSVYSANAGTADFDIPVKEANMLIGGKGDAFYHPSIYRGKGKVTHAADILQGVTTESLHNEGTPQELIAMRARDPKVRARGLAKAMRLEGTDYKEQSDTIKHGLKHLLGFTERTGKPNCGKNGILCTEYVAESFSDIFPDKLAGPRDLKLNENLDFAARYSPKTHGITANDKMLQYGAYPAAKMAKYGLLAAGVGYGASELAKYLEKRGARNA